MDNKKRPIHMLTTVLSLTLTHISAAKASLAPAHNALGRYGVWIPKGLAAMPVPNAYKNHLRPTAILLCSHAA